MTRQRKAQLVTLGVLVAALGVVAVRRSGWSARELFSGARRGEPSPQDAVYAMLDAAREGNVRKYLAAHTGQLEAALRQTIAEKGEAAFAAYLRQFNAPIKGVAILEPQPLTEHEVRLRVEYVYRDRNEAQTMYLEKLSGTWKIARVEAAERVKTLIPYGTPVQ